MRMTKEKRRSQIIEYATDLFSKHGYDKVTTKQLADICQITEPALYRYFHSKDAIYDAVLDSLEFRLESAEIFRQLEKEADVEKLLHSLATHIIDFFSRNEDIYRLLLFATLRNHPKAKHVFQSIRGGYVRFLKEQLERLHQAGQIIERDYEITARCFIGMVFDCALSTTLWKQVLERQFMPQQIVGNNVPIYARGLRNQP